MSVVLESFLMTILGCQPATCCPGWFKPLVAKLLRVVGVQYNSQGKLLYYNLRNFQIFLPVNLILSPGQHLERSLISHIES